MSIFGTFGIPIVTLLLSLVHPHLTLAQNMPKSEPPHFARVLIRASSTPTPTEEPTPSASPTTIMDTGQPSSPESSGAEQVRTYIMDQINTYRTSLGLSQAVTNDGTCQFAKTRAEEISNNFSHDGFHQRIQNNTLPYPKYALVTENIAETSNYQDVVTMWKNSAPHAENMRADTPYICVEAYDNYYAFEGWKPL